MLLKAALGLEKNITPNREKAASNEVGSNGYAWASAWRNRTRSHPCAVFRANARTAADRSTPTTVPSGATARASFNAVVPPPQRYPGHSHLISVQAPPERDDRAARVAVPIAPGPRPTRALVPRLRSTPAGNCCDSLRGHRLLLIAQRRRATLALKVDHHSRVSSDQVYEQARAGSNSPGASGGSASFCRKHEAWHFQTCHLPPDVSTVTLHGSTLVVSMSRPQKQQGPNLIETPGIAEVTSAQKDVSVQAAPTGSKCPNACHPSSRLPNRTDRPAR
jgi:hypothetical protein